MNDRFVVSKYMSFANDSTKLSWSMEQELNCQVYAPFKGKNNPLITWQMVAHHSSAIALGTPSW